MFIRCSAQRIGNAHVQFESVGVVEAFRNRLTVLQNRFLWDLLQSLRRSMKTLQQGSPTYEWSQKLPISHLCTLCNVLGSIASTCTHIDLTFFFAASSHSILVLAGKTSRCCCGMAFVAGMGRTPFQNFKSAGLERHWHNLVMCAVLNRPHNTKTFVDKESWWAVDMKRCGCAVLQKSQRGLDCRVLPLYTCFRVPGYLQDGGDSDEDAGRRINTWEENGQNIPPDGQEPRRETLLRRIHWRCKEWSFHSSTFTMWPQSDRRWYVMTGLHQAALSVTSAQSCHVFFCISWSKLEYLVTFVNYTKFGWTHGSHCQWGEGVWLDHFLSISSPKQTQKQHRQVERKHDREIAKLHAVPMKQVFEPDYAFLCWL